MSEFDPHFETIVLSVMNFFESAFWADLREGKCYGKIPIRKFRPVSKKVGWVVKDRLEERGFYLFKSEDSIYIRRMDL